MSNLEGTINDIYSSMPYYKELFNPENSPSTEIPDTIDPNDPINGVNKVASLALQKLNENLAKVSLPDRSILDQSKSPANNPPLSQVIEDVLKEIENKFVDDSTPVASKLDGKCLNEPLTGTCDLSFNPDNKLVGTISGSVAGKGNFNAEIPPTDLKSNLPIATLKNATNNVIKGTITGNCNGFIEVGNTFTAKCDLELKISDIQLSSNTFKNLFILSIETNTTLNLTTLTNADIETQADLMSKDLVGCPTGLMNNGVCISITIADLVNLTGISFPSFDMLYDALKASLPLIVKYVPCLAVILTIITIIIGIIKIVTKIIEILVKLKPVLELIRKIIQCANPFSGFSTCPELAQDLALMVIAILKNILLTIPIILWNMIKDKKILVVCVDEAKALC